MLKNSQITEMLYTWRIIEDSSTGCTLEMPENASINQVSKLLVGWMVRAQRAKLQCTQCKRKFCLQTNLMKHNSEVHVLWTNQQSTVPPMKQLQDRGQGIILSPLHKCMNVEKGFIVKNV